MIKVILVRYQMEMRNVFWKLEERHGFYEVGMSMAGSCLWSHVL